MWEKRGNRTHSSKELKIIASHKEKKGGGRKIYLDDWEEGKRHRSNKFVNKGRLRGFKKAMIITIVKKKT